MCMMQSPAGYSRQFCSEVYWLMHESYINIEYEILNRFSSNLTLLLTIVGLPVIQKLQVVAFPGK